MEFDNWKSMFSTCTRPKHTQVHSCNEGHRDVPEFPVGLIAWNLGALQSYLNNSPDSSSLSFEKGSHSVLPEAVIVASQ
jgi:hypothetical protein